MPCRRFETSLLHTFGQFSVVNAMNAMLTAVDCASSALMLGAAGFDEEETSTFNDIAFVLQLLALIGGMNARQKHL